MIWTYVHMLFANFESFVTYHPHYKLEEGCWGYIDFLVAAAEGHCASFLPAAGLAILAGVPFRWQWQQLKIFGTQEKNRQAHGKKNPVRDVRTSAIEQGLQTHQKHSCSLQGILWSY